MQVTSATPTTAAGPFAGVFGQQNQGEGGLFGLLMSLFGQMGGEAGTQGLDGQIVPSPISGLPQAMPNLPIMGLIEGSFMPEAIPTDPAGLLNWLKGLSESGTSISAELDALLAGDNLDLADFQKRIATLNEPDRDKVMGEIAALLQPVFERPIAPIRPIGEASGLIHTGPEGPKQPITPLPESLPESLPQRLQENALPIKASLPEASRKSEGQSETTPSLSRDALVAANQKEADTKADGKNTALTAAIVAITRNGKETAQVKLAPIAESALPAPISLPPVDQPAATTQAEVISRVSKPTTDMTSANSSTAAAALALAQAEAKEPSARTIPGAGSDGVKPIMAAAVAAAGASADAGFNSLGSETASQQLQQLTGVEKPAALPFADHLQVIKLNRTGAHVPVADQISVQLSKAVSEGKDRFTVRLSPAELGRIEIRIEMSGDGQITASFKVDQPATLDLLQRDQRGLERMLSDAGLKADSSSLNFNLRGDGNGQHNNGQQAQNDHGSKGQAGLSPDAEALTDEVPAAGVIEATWYVGHGRLDVSV